MNKLKTVLTATLFILLSGLESSAQVIIHKNLSIDDGLVYSQVLYIHEDQRGFMWFGTSSGISRWDGINFKNFILPRGLPDNNCKWIAEFQDSTLFFATRKGLVRYKNNQFSAIPGAPDELNHWIHSLLLSADDKLYIATDTSGLWIYDGRQFNHLGADNGLPSNSVRAIAEGADGCIYIGLYADQILTWRNGTLNPLKLDVIPPDIVVTCLFEDHNGALWIGTQDQGIYVFDQGSVIHLSHQTVLPGSTVNQITRGETNQIFVATDDGLAVLENYRLQLVLDEKNGLSNNFVWFVNRDSNGIFYIGTDGGGVDVYRPGLFQTINSDCGLPHNTVWAILETQDHDFYFGTDRGLALFDRNEVKVIDTSTGLSDNMVLCLHEGKDGKVYLGTNNQGVDVIDRGRIRNINTQLGLDGSSVWTITEDSHGLIYFGTYDGGINIWDGQRIMDTINLAGGLPSDAIVSSYRSADGSLYFGTDGSGVVRIVNRQIDSLLLPGNTIWSIYEDANHNWYFGTNDRGLIYFRHGKWDTLSIDHGLSHNSILGIMEDAQGKLYLTADNGLNVVEFLPQGQHIRVMGGRDGLAGSECNQGAYFKDSQGFLWIGTVKGVSRLDPARAEPNPNPPRLHWSRLQSFDMDLPVSALEERRSFKHNENYFRFEFIGIDLSAPHKVRYRYRLSGLDQDWIETDHPVVRYYIQNADDYTFEIIAGNEWDYWSEPLQLSFTILPPFWKTWWFIVLAFLVILSPLVVVIRLRIQRLLALERLRAQIAADLHDDIGAGLSEINILSAVAATKTPAQARPVIENELNKIGQTARSLVERMSDIVWLVNPHKDALSDLIARLTDSFADLFDAKGIIFQATNAQTLNKIRLDMNYRQHLFMILKEAVHNAVKYSAAEKIELNVNHQGKTLVLQLKDNGQGFDSSLNKTGNGLLNMKKRAAQIGGILQVNSSPGMGTMVEFRGKV